MDSDNLTVEHVWGPAVGFRLLPVLHQAARHYPPVDISFCFFRSFIIDFNDISFFPCDY